MDMRWREEKILLVLLLVSACVIYSFTNFPPYTKWAIILLILPSVFAIARSGSKLDPAKTCVACLGSVIGAWGWDTAAMSLGTWGFPVTSVSGYLIGIPIEEYIFAVSIPIFALGVYTSLPAFRKQVYDGPRISENPLLIGIFILQSLVLWSILHSNAAAYIKWLLLLAIIPAIFYLWRKGEKIDEIRLFITCLVAVTVTFIVDPIFILSGSWYYGENALLGKIWVVPIEDILFSIFLTVLVVGFYTSLPKKHLLTGRW